MNRLLPLTSLFCTLLLAMAAPAAEPPGKCYLFSYFLNNGEDGLHLAWSADGLKWQALKSGGSFLTPSVGGRLMRDPCITTGPDGTFHMVWTDSWKGGTIGYASSKDLIHWSGQKALPVMAHEPATRNCWAPEIIWDPAANHFRIFWASTIPGRFPATQLDGRNDSNHRIYATTTKDFLTFSPTELFFDPGYNVIDATLLSYQSKTFMIFKDETKVPTPMKNLRLATAPGPSGPFTVRPEPINPPGSWVEGPTALEVGDQVILYFDAYTRHQYEALASKDLKTWSDVTRELVMPQGIRHGTAFEVPARILKGLLNPAGPAHPTDGPVDPPADQRRPSPGDTTYHIDPVAGDDRHAGTARDSAWKSFLPLNRLILAAGDRVEILAPGSFDQTLALAGAGTAAKPIEVRFAPGRYDFHPAHAHREAYQISNTNDDPEGRKAVAILLDGAKHLRLSGPGASVVCRGKMIEVCVDGCEEVVISGLTFDYHRPTVSEFRVVEIGDGHVDLAIHTDSHYSIEDGKITWLGEGWSKTTGLAQELDPESGIVRRRRDPLAGLQLEEIKPFLLRARGRHDMKPGRIYQIRDIRRDCAGVFVRHSRDITWRDVNFRFLHGMGLVHQFSENLTFDSVTIAPDPARGRTTAAWADCLHLSGCKGKVRVLNSVFSGAHDDAINIHGTYLKLAGRISDREIRVRFMHKQTFGFMAFHPGDEIEFLRSDTMASYASNRVIAVRMEDLRNLVLTLENALPDDPGDNDVIENVTWTPDVEIRGCKVSHIPTRGFLLATRGKVLVEDNEFLATNMSAIQIDADAVSWFESGAVRDLTIRRNRFIRCGDPVIDIHPRNTAPNPAFHRNIRIENNQFVLRGKHAVSAKSTQGLRVTGNSIHSDAKAEGDVVITRDCEDVIIQDNRIMPEVSK